jgi:hypothetical protein
MPQNPPHASGQDLAGKGFQHRAKGICGQFPPTPALVIGMIPQHTPLAGTGNGFLLT